MIYPQSKPLCKCGKLLRFTALTALALAFALLLAVPSAFAEEADPSTAAPDGAAVPVALSTETNADGDPNAAAPDADVAVANDTGSDRTVENLNVDEGVTHTIGSGLTLRVSLASTINGTLVIEKGATLVIQKDSNIRFNASAVLQGNGALIIEDGGTFSRQDGFSIVADGNDLAYGEDFTYVEIEGGIVLRVRSDKAMTVANGAGVTSTRHSISVDSESTARLTLENVRIESVLAPIELVGDASLNLTLATGSVNTLTAPSNCAGISVPSAAQLTVDGTGSLTVAGGANAAGIGSFSGAGGTVIVNSGNVTAIGGANAVGIGGGFVSGTDAAGRSLKVYGGTVVATGGANATKDLYVSELTVEGGILIAPRATVDAYYYNKGIVCSTDGAGAKTLTLCGDQNVGDISAAFHAVTDPATKAALSDYLEPESEELIIRAAQTVIDEGATLRVTDQGDCTLLLFASKTAVTVQSRANLTNIGGAVSFGANSALTLEEGSTFANDGGVVSFNIFSAMNVGAGGSFSNINGARFTTSGTVRIEGGGTQRGEVVNSDSTFIVNPDGEMTIGRDRSFVNMNGAHFITGGALTLDALAQLIVHGSTYAVTDGFVLSTEQAIFYGDDFTYGDVTAPDTLTVKNDATLTVSNQDSTTTTSHTILVERPTDSGIGGGVPMPITVGLTLDGVKIACDSSDSSSPLAVGVGDTLNLTFAAGSENTMAADDFSNYAGLNVPEGAALSIDGAGRLTVTGGSFAAGIGGNKEESSGDITIRGDVTVAAAIGTFGRGAGIGGGQSGDGGYVSIRENATVTAETGTFGRGAGIGGGQSGDGGIITIGDGAIVNASSGSFGAGIGGGQDGTGGDVSIGDNAVVTAIGGDRGAAGIGAGNGATDHGTFTTTLVGGSITSLDGASLRAAPAAAPLPLPQPDDSSSAVFIVASSIGDQSDKANWSGAIITPNATDPEAVYHETDNLGTGKLYGGDSYTLGSNATIPAGYSLVLTKGQSLEVASEKTLTIAAKGALVIEKGASHKGTVTVETDGKLVDNNPVVVPTPTPTPTPEPTATPAPAQKPSKPSTGGATVTVPTVVVTPAPDATAPTSPATGETNVFAWIVAWFAQI